jgi:hypothetical protein
MNMVQSLCCKLLNDLTRMLSLYDDNAFNFLLKEIYGALDL